MKLNRAFRAQTRSSARSPAVLRDCMDNSSSSSGNSSSSSSSNSSSTSRTIMTNHGSETNFGRTAGRLIVPILMAVAFWTPVALCQSNVPRNAPPDTQTGDVGSPDPSSEGPCRPRPFLGGETDGVSTAWLGANLGNIPLFPFRAARVEQDEVEIRQLLRDAVTDLADAGGNLLRVWFHIDGAMDPCWGPNRDGPAVATCDTASTAEAATGEYIAFSGSGCVEQLGLTHGPFIPPEPEVVQGCGGAAVGDLKWLLRQCHRRGVKVLLTLWSHDVLAVRRDNPPANRDRALHMIRTSVGTAAYVDRCLTPLVRHLAATSIPPSYSDDDALEASDLAELARRNAAVAAASSSLWAVGNPSPSSSPSPSIRNDGTLWRGRRLAAEAAVMAMAMHSADNVSTQVMSLLQQQRQPQPWPQLQQLQPQPQPQTQSMSHPHSQLQLQLQPQTQQLQPRVQPQARSDSSITSAPLTPSTNSHGVASGRASRKPAAAESGSDSSAAAIATATAPGGGLKPAGRSGGGTEGYSSVIAGYDLLNEPEGMSWDLRLYHNYMYDMEWGSYTYENPDYADARPERATDHRSFQVLKAFGGRSFPAKNRTDVLLYEGWHFVSGNEPSGVRAEGEGADARNPPCLSDGSYITPSSGTYDTASSDVSPDWLTYFMNAAHPRTDDTDSQRRGTCSLPAEADLPAAVKSMAVTTATPVPWYGNASLAARWEALALSVSRTPPGRRSRAAPVRNGMAFNHYMYKDVISQHNSELPYMLPMVVSCRLRTTDVSVPQLQRFISRLAAAVHNADPRAKVTVGAHSMPYCTDAQRLKDRINTYEHRPRNLYSDQALMGAFLRSDGSLEAGWDPSGAGTLDFYSPHGYPDWGREDVTRRISPFYMSACDLELDKPTLIGEFWNKVSDNDPLTADHWQHLYDRGGYMGGLGWAMLQVVEEPVRSPAPPGAAGVRQVAAPRRIMDHENRRLFLTVLREITSRRQQGENSGK